MKALSGYAEWFWLMAKNWKDVENRPKPLPRAIAIDLPVRIYLHASKTHATNEEISFIRSKLSSQQLLEFDAVDWSKYRGHIIGEITITKQFKKHIYRESEHVDVGSQQRELEIYLANNEAVMSPWFFGKFGYAVKDGELYDSPIPYRGQLGFFEVQISINV